MNFLTLMFTEPKQTNMKKIICILTMAIALGSFAQKKLSTDYSYTVSEPYKVVDAEEKFYLSDEQGGVLTIKFDGKEIYIQRFDGNKPGLLREKKYESFLPKHYVVEDVKKLGNKYYVFYSLWDGDNDKEQLFAAEVDFDKAEFSGAPQLMMKVDGKVTGNYSGRMMDFDIRNKFDVMTSYDKKAILVKYRKKPEVKNDKKSFDIIGLGSFDGNLKKTATNEITMPYTERRMNNLDYQIDSKGNLYMLTKVFHDDSNDDKKSKKDTVANYHIELFTIKSGSDKMNTTKLENKDKFINSLFIFDLPSSTSLIAGGYYSNGKGKNFMDNSDGVMTFKIKEDGTVFDQFNYDIPLEIINEYESEKSIKKNKRKEEKGEGAKLTGLRLNDLEAQKDGSLVLVGEQFKIVSRTYTSNTGTKTVYNYYYEDILVTKINPDGNLGWMSKVPKKQIGAKGQGGMSYKFFSTPAEYYLVFLDNVKNIDLPKDKAPEVHSDGKGGYLTGVRLSAVDGTYKKGSILNAREVDDFKLHQFSTNRIIKTSDSSFIVEAYKKSKEDIMVKVVLK